MEKGKEGGLAILLAGPKGDGGGKDKKEDYSEKGLDAAVGEFVKALKDDDTTAMKRALKNAVRCMK